MSEQQYAMITADIPIYFVATKEEAIAEAVEIFDGDEDKARADWDNEKSKYLLDDELMNEYREAFYVFLSVKRQVSRAVNAMKAEREREGK